MGYLSDAQNKTNTENNNSFTTFKSNSGSGYLSQWRAEQEGNNTSNSGLLSNHYNQKIADTKPKVNEQRDVYSPVTPTQLRETQFIQGKAKETNVWGKITGFFDRIFSGSEETQAKMENAEAQNAYAVLKVSGQELVEKRVEEIAKTTDLTYDETKTMVEGLAREKGQSVYDVVGLSLTNLSKPGSNPLKQSLMEEITRVIGVRTDPTNSEVVEGLMSLSIITGLTAPSILPKVGGKVVSRISILKGLGTYTAFKEFNSGLISAVKGDGFKFGSGYTLSDLYSGNNRSVPALLDTLEFIGIGAITGLAHKAPKLSERFTKDFITKYKLPERIEIDPKVVRDVVIGKNAGYEKDLIASLGLTSKEWRVAVKQGITVEVPAERLIYVVDKPYWKKLKSVFGKTSEPTLLTKVSEGKTVKGVKGFLEEGKPVEGKVEPTKPVVTPKKTVTPVTTKGIETAESLTKELVDTYKKVGDPVEKAVSEVYAELEMSEAGKRYFTEDGVIGQNSSFPEWIPEEYRQKALFDKVLGGLKQVSDIKYPDSNSPRQRAFYNALLDEVDSRAGIDTSQLRNVIMGSNETGQIKQSKKTVSGSLEGGQATINQANTPKVVSKAPDLTQEARNAGSLEDLTKTLHENPKQGVYFHGTSTDFNTIDPKKLSTRDTGDYGSGFYMSNSPLLGGDYSKTSPSFKNSSDNFIKTVNGQDLKLATATEIETIFQKETGKNLRDLTPLKTKSEEYKRIALENGYDGIDVSGDGFTVAVFNTDKLILGKNLDTIFNQANTPITNKNLSDNAISYSGGNASVGKFSDSTPENFIESEKLIDERSALQKQRKENKATTKEKTVDRAVKEPTPKVTSERRIGTGENSIAQTPIGSGKPKESRAYKRVRDRLEAESQLDVNYNTLNLEQNATNALNYIASNPDSALRIAFGIEEPTTGVTESAISIALADKAGREGKFRLQSQLESSRSLRQTRRGQETVSERGRFDEDSSYRFIQEVLDRRLKDIGRSSKGEIIEIAQTVKGEESKKMGAKKKAVAKIDNEVIKIKAKIKADAVKIRKAQDIIDALRC